MARVGSSASLSVDPGRPFAGRDISFTLEGLEPWREIAVEFVGPRGEPAEWITEDEARFAWIDGAPVTERTLYADGSGRVRWVRIGTQDREGVWSVRITVGGQTTTVSYPISQLQLPEQQRETVGAEFHRHQGLAADIYYSGFVPSTLAVDLQEHLAWVTDELWERLGIQSRQIPDIYLTGNRGLFEEVSRAIGEEVGFEAGYYISRGPRPGIYMRTDFLRSEVRMLLTHEYLHLVLDELAGSTPLPAWLHEGLAKYYEYEFSLQGERPNGARRLLYRNADTARSAALSGALLSLPSLESQADWNSQIDEARIRLQYAEAYMAVRFLTENHGANAPIDIARALAGGARLTDALQGSIALSYGEFQERLEGWLETWEDPTRTQIGEYIRTLDGIMSSEDAISQRRATDLESGDPLFQRVPVKRALVSDAEELVRELRNTPHPPRLESLHDDTLAYLATVVEWLSLELEYAETGMDSRRTQANEMISEIQARTNLVRRAIERERFTFHISNGL